MTDQMDVLASQLAAALSSQITRAMSDVSAKMLTMEERLLGIEKQQNEQLNDLRAEMVRHKADIDSVEFPPGPIGHPGPRGEPGPAGTPGSDGQPGQRGEKGPTGDRGERGEPGSPGTDGKPGERGDPGAVGERGERGLQGVQGDHGPAGIDGVAGVKGDPGQPGRDGEPGRDALQIDVLDAVDDERIYPRNTYAYYAGGIVRSHRRTDPIGEGKELERCGWCVVVRGIDAMDVDVDRDLRSAEVSIRLTGGEWVRKTVTIPALLDRGVWRDGPFTRGDAATWDGSLWIAQRDVLPGEKPGDDSGAWRLAVKRGSHGRDGPRGDPGQRGAEGRAGRDLTQMGLDGRKY